MKKGIPILKGAGLESVENLPRTAVGFSSLESISGSATTAQVACIVEW